MLRHTLLQRQFVDSVTSLYFFRTYSTFFTLYRSRVTLYNEQFANYVYNKIIFKLSLIFINMLKKFKVISSLPTVSFTKNAFYLL